jgi:hypothetical protein
VALGPFKNNDFIRPRATRESFGIVATGALTENLDLAADQSLEFECDMAVHHF